MQTAPIEFQPSGANPPPVFLPDSGRLFAERADRFAALAHGHSLADWLNFLGHLSRAQHEAQQALPEIFLPDAAVQEQLAQHGMPPLNAIELPRPAFWRDVARRLATAMATDTPSQAKDALSALQSAPDERLEKLADALLGGEPDPKDAAELTIVAAALQVIWTAMASRLTIALRPIPESPSVCPCCGSLPVASVLRVSPTINNLRYLHCSLCNTEWNVARATCTACSTDQDVAYQQIEGSNGAVRAETCDSCKSYLKIMVQDKDAKVDPVADDLATLALDILVDEAGYLRSGPNLFLFGSADE